VYLWDEYHLDRFFLFYQITGSLESIPLCFQKQGEVLLPIFKLPVVSFFFKEGKSSEPLPENAYQCTIGS